MDRLDWEVSPFLLLHTGYMAGLNAPRRLRLCYHSLGFNVEILSSWIGHIKNRVRLGIEQL